jgi:ATP-dependent phosphoenolpyruvate carboxykinase
MKNHDGKYGRGRWARNKATADYLNVSAMTLWRWKHDPALGFPAAAVVNGIEHNNLDAVDAWMNSRIVDRAAKTEYAA